MQQQKQKADPDRLRLLRRTDVCEMLGISSWTLGRWIRRSIFPKPLYITNDSPARWRSIDIENWLAKKAHSRRVRPEPRGSLKQYAEDKR
jgi:predicted DNA-binding transcriptional regulator AlpA